MQRPQPQEYAKSMFTSRYVDLVPSDDVLAELSKGLQEVQSLFTSLSESQLNYRYAPGKWTPKEILAHMIDTERILSYRALCIARGEKQPLPGFDEEAYAALANYGQRALTDLLQEHRLIR